MSNPGFKLIFVIANLIVIAGLFGSVRDLWRRRDIIRDRSQALEAVTAENRRLKEALTDAQTPEFIEREARNRLNLARPHETVVIMEKAAEASGSSGLQRTETPSWRSWWQLFF